jgi:acetylornithine deacetylase/succinyl-diaminopimelate desuccinylase-like protein
MQARLLPVAILMVLFFSLHVSCACALDDRTDEAMKILGDYLRIDTTNPPGREIDAARFFAALCEREKIDHEIFEYAPGRANFYCRLRGDGSRKAIILLNHSDVVPADRAKWSVDPFSGIVKGGFIYGRGAIDMKSMGIIELMTLFKLKRSGVPLTRDIIFLSVADEEVMSTGAEWMARQRKDLIEGAEFLIDECGYIHVGEEPAHGHEKLLYYEISPTEKAPLWVKITARGKPGHASSPEFNSAPNRLVRALSRILADKPPLIVLPASKKFFADMKLGDLDRAPADPALQRMIDSNHLLYGMTHNTITLTRLEGSNAINVIPSEASAHIDCRLLPGEDPGEFLKTLKSIIADETIELSVICSYPANASPIDTELFRAIRKVAQDKEPGALVTTTISTYCDDSHYFRDLGIHCYGFVPVRYTDAEVARGHGNDERISVENMRFGVEFLYDLMVEMNKK